MNINELTSQDIGASVIYVPDGKQGKITSFNGRFVFVAFSHTAGRGEAVRPEDLLRVSTDGNKGLEEVRCEVCGKVIMVNGSWTDETAGVCSGFCERELCGECGQWVDGPDGGECPQCHKASQHSPAQCYQCGAMTDHFVNDEPCCRDCEAELLSQAEGVEPNPFKGSEDERNCHCNYCEAKFREGEIVIKNGEEYCPSCGQAGYIGDDPKQTNNQPGTPGEGEKYGA
jgi:hypothetical protein